MNENLNLVEILKDCPKGTKLYSTVHGEVEYMGINDKSVSLYRIKFKTKDGDIYGVTQDGRYLHYFNGESILFPSKEHRDWSKFQPKKPKFDPKTLQPFDRVLVKCLNNSEWLCNIFSHIEPHSNFCFCANDTAYKIYIPYNDDTKHLVGTYDEAPEFYRYWED